MTKPPFFTDQGEGDTAVFLLHGVGGGHRAFDANVPALVQAGLRVVVWDAPGYGRSRDTFGTRGRLSMTQFAESLLTLVDVVGARRNVVLGHSMGGMIAQEACFLRPEAIQGLVLFATSPAFGKPGGDWQNAFLQSRFAPLDAGLGMAGLAPQLVDGMVAQSASPAARQAATQLMSGVPEATYRAALSAIVSFNRLDNLQHIQVPTLCLACDEDKTAPPAVMQKMAGRIPGARYHCLAQAGHLGNMEQPGAFNAAVLQFLQQEFSVTDPNP